jgi:hypothetical protein
MEVYALIARLSSLGDDSMSLDSGDTNDDWSRSPELLTRMYEESPKAMKDILRALAARPDEWLTAPELAQAIQHKPNADWNTVAGTLGAFGRRVKNRYKRRSWPFLSQWDHSRGRFLYSMSPDVARQINDLAANARNK